MTTEYDYRFSIHGEASAAKDLLSNLHLHGLDARTACSHDRWTGPTQFDVIAELKKASKLHSSAYFQVVALSADGPRGLYVVLAGQSYDVTDIYVRSACGLVETCDQYVAALAFGAMDAYWRRQADQTRMS
jgi:hypothetical protein